MELEIKCFATLTDYAPADGFLYNLAGGTDVAGVMECLDLPPEEVKIIFVNGVHAEPETVLKDGDRVGFFPAVGGG